MDYRRMILGAIVVILLLHSAAGQSNLLDNYQCSSASCGENETYRSCGVCYQQFCSQDFYVSCPYRCYCGCYCRTGYVRDEPINGRCILQAGCPSLSSTNWVQLVDFSKM